MEVAGLLLSAISFVDSAAKTGSMLAQLFKDSEDAGKHVYNAAQRLEAQKYTLELWQGIWTAKAQRKLKPTVEDGLRETWGDEGYAIILKCLAQLNIKFGEAFRTLRSIDPDSFKDAPSRITLPEHVSRESSTRSSMFAVTASQILVEESSHPSLASTSSLDSKGPVMVETVGNAISPTRKKHWYHRISGSMSKGKGIWRNKTSNVSPLASKVMSAGEQAELEQKALQHKLSPGTKFRWSITHKEQIRLMINDIDEWLALLQTLASRSEEERNETKAGKISHPSGIRAAARALHTALRNSPSSQNLEFKLEKERTDSSYFEQILGPVDFVDQTNRSYKFPLLISNSKTGDGPMFLLAEAIYAPAVAAPSLYMAGKETPLDEIIKGLRDPVPKSLKTSTSVLYRSQHTTIVIHALTADDRRPASAAAVSEAFPKCSFADLLQAEATVDPLVALWKRLQLACIIAISVLHLYETGWISEHLETNDFHFFGAADSQYHELARIAPYVSAITRPKIEPVSKTPFDILQRNPIVPSLLGSSDERLAILFHRLGIVLFEVGRGVQHRELFDGWEGSETEVTAEIDKIPFGRPYRDLVKTCLTGSLYATSAVHIDTQFNRAVVER